MCRDNGTCSKSEWCAGHSLPPEMHAADGEQPLLIIYNMKFDDHDSCFLQSFSCSQKSNHFIFKSFLSQNYLRRFVTLVIAILTFKYLVATLRLLILVRTVHFCWTLSIQDEKLRCASHYVAYLRTAEKDPHAMKTFDRRLPFEVEELAFAAGTEAAIQTRWAIHGWKKFTKFMSPNHMIWSSFTCGLFETPELQK